MLSGLILIGRGLDRKGKRAWKKKNYCLVLSVLKTLDKKNLVMIAWWTHLYPFRTQKLSIIAAKIVHCAKIARCQFLLFFYVLRIFPTWSLIGHALVVWLFFLICVIASYKIEIILSCYYLMFINFLKILTFCMNYYWKLVKKDLFSRPLLLHFYCRFN